MARKPAALWLVSIMALAAAAMLLTRRESQSAGQQTQTDGVRYSAGL